MSEFDLYKLAAIDETVSHFFFPALALSHARCTYSESGTSSSGDERPYDPRDDLEPIRIPETILYSYSKPILWFYYDDATQRILKRPTKYLNTQTILEHFTESSKSRIGVRAWYIFPQEAELITPQTSDFPVDIVSQDALGSTGLLRFLQYPKGKGILQHYIDNKTESDGSMKNVFIHCDYSPSHFSTELYVSVKTLTIPTQDSKKKQKHGGASAPSAASTAAARAAGVALSLRFSPYASAYERRPLVSSVMTTRLENLCKSVVNRIRKLLACTVASMQLVCRMDAEDKLYILWCGSMRCHAPLYYPHLSFRLTPQGTVHEPYSLAERARLVNAAKEEQKAQASRFLSTTPSAIALREEAEDHQAAAQRVLALLSNLSASEDTVHEQAAADPQRSGITIRLGNGVPSSLNGSLSLGAESPTMAVDLSKALLRCCVCHEERQRGALVKVQLQWVLFCLSPMDNLSSRLWDQADDVPPSVALVCPHLSKAQFDRLVAMDKERLWLQTHVGVCVKCVSDCNKGNDLMCAMKKPAASWLGIDETYKPSMKRQLQLKSTLSNLQHKHSPLESASMLVDLLTYYHHQHADEATTDRDPMLQLKALVSAQTHADDVIQRAAQRRTLPPVTQERRLYGLSAQRRRSLIVRAAVTSWEGNAAVSFVGATREHADAADLYKRDREGVYRRCGFGRPVVNTRFVPPVPHVFENTTLRDSMDELLSRIALFERITDAERLELCHVSITVELPHRPAGSRLERQPSSAALAPLNPAMLDATTPSLREATATVLGRECPDVPCHTPL